MTIYCFISDLHLSDQASNSAINEVSVHADQEQGRATRRRGKGAVGKRAQRGGSRV